MLRFTFACLALLSAVCTAAAQRSPYDNRPIQITADLTDAPRKLLRATLSIPVKPGPLTLLYPKWIPGEHSPSGPIDNMAGLRFEANGQVIPWQRDSVDMFAFHLTVPAGVSTLTAQVNFLATAAASGFSSGASTSPNLCVLSWNALLLYPAGVPAAQVRFEPSVRLPEGWQFGTALVQSSAASTLTKFEPVSLETLVDSPLLSGRYFKEIPLAPEVTPKHFLDLAADGPEDLNVNKSDLESFGNLVREAGRLYASHHYASYHFLLTLSDSVAHFGLEHHQSSDDRVDARTFLDDDLRLLSGSLLPHEFTHSWNGKFRRPAGLVTSTYGEPMRGDLLWIYEGLTQYLGDVLAVRSGLWTPDQFKSYIASSAASLDHRPGRNWRNLADTAVAAQTLYETGLGWDNWRRSVDYYPEGELIWLEADTTIRTLSTGKRSLNDFIAAFYGVGGDTPPKLLPYTLPDVVRALNTVQPFDWNTFFHDRVTVITPHAPLAGLQKGGYSFDYTAQPNDFDRAEESKHHGLNAWYSLGMYTGTEGIADVLIDSPAYRAGLGPGMKLVAIDGRTYTDELLRTAIDNSKTNPQPLEFIIESAGYYKTLKVNYSSGQKYPHLKREGNSTDWLEQILKPLISHPQMSPAG